MRVRVLLALITAVVVMFICTTTVTAQENYLETELKGISNNTTPAQEPSLARLSVKMLIVLIIIVGLIIVLGFGLKKFMKGRRLGADKITTVLSVTHIVDRKYVAIIEVLGRTLIIGIGADSVTLLSEISAPFLSETGDGQTSSPESGNPQEAARDFTQVLGDKLSNENATDNPSFLEALSDQVKKKISRIKR